MKRSAFARTLVTAAALAGTPMLAAALEVAGVTFDDTAHVQGSTLQLNGAGVRYKAVFKVYAGALYLVKKTGSAEEVIAQPGAKRVVFAMLRDVDATEMGKLFTQGVEANSPRSEFVALIPALSRMGQIFADFKTLKAGDQARFDYVPGKGTILYVKGEQQGEPFKDAALINAMIRNWIGPSPADFNLKDALLGRPKGTSGISN